MINVYIRSSDYELSIKKKETFEKYNKVIQWGRKYPTRFVEDILGIQLLDYQKYVFLNSWYTPFVVWCMGRNSGKTFLSVPLIMSKSLLIPNHETYILSNKGNQAQNTFLKLEKTAKKQISSLTGLTDVFFNEVFKGVTEQDGFSHKQSGYSVKLFNSSAIYTLNGVPENNVGYRSNLNFYDEAGKIDRNMFELTEPFTTQNTDFALGGNIDLSVLPKSFRNQIIYASSAEDTDSYFWDKYKDYSMKMISGDSNFFVADINCEIVLHPTFNGDNYAPLLIKETIENALRQNEEKALREYYNIFSTDGGKNNPFKRSTIIKNSEPYAPILQSEGADKHYVITYDPALQRDNAFILIGEVWKDEEMGWLGRICNGVNLIRKMPNGEKKPLITPEQIKWLKRIILTYNGNAKEYVNIINYIDPGSGGGGRNIATYLLSDWYDEDGNLRPGMIDNNDDSMKLEAPKFPNARDCLRLPNPQKYKLKMFDALAEMLNQDRIKFPNELNLRNEIEYQELNENNEVIEKIYHLTEDESLALSQIDLMKEEIVNMQKVETSQGKSFTYKLPSNKENKMHDDRAYCLAMFGYHLSELIANDILNRGDHHVDYSQLFGKSRNKNINKFNIGSNPFVTGNHNSWLN